MLRRNVTDGHVQRIRSCSERSLTLATRVAAGRIVPSVASASCNQQGRGSNAPSQQFWRGACGRLAAAIEGTDGRGGGRRGICRRARRSHTVSACAAAGQAVPRSGMHGVYQELTCCTIAGERCSRCTRGQLTRAKVLRRTVSGGHLQRTRSWSERSLTLATRVPAGRFVPSVARTS